MYFDTHAHLDDERFSADRDEVIRALPARGVTRVLNAASDMPSSRMTVSLCEEYDMIYGAVGVHPHAAEEMTDADLLEIEALTKKKKIVAIGEVGLDYYYDTAPREVQKKRFFDQAALAYELKLPLVVHDRDAHRDCFDILKNFPNLRVVYHCFSASVEYAREILKLGFYMSFGGSLTFKNAVTAPEVVKMAPRERIMLETDCPYLTPVPHRGKRNDPGFVPLVAAKIGELWGISPEEVGKITTKNANTFFGIV